MDITFGNTEKMKSDKSASPQELDSETHNLPVPSSSCDSCSDIDEDSFLLGLYIFGKNFTQVKRFIESKRMGDILFYYYGKFYGSSRYHRWADCRKMKSKRCIYGRKIFTGSKQKELLSRLIPHASEDCQLTIREVSRTFGEGKLSLEEYVSTLKATVGLKMLTEAVGIGKQKQDLTGIAVEQLKSNNIPKRPNIPIGKACSTLTTVEIINFLTGDFRLSKARTSDLFREAVWPRLLTRGWHSEELKDNGCKEVFLVPGIKKFSRSKLVKGNHYFDSVSDVLSKISSDPGLLELDTEDDKGCACREESKCISETKLKEDTFPDIRRHCYLKPRIPAHARDNMEFTLSDRSLANVETREVSKTFGEGEISLEQNLSTLKVTVEPKMLTEAVGIGKDKHNLTGITMEQLKLDRVPNFPKIPIGNAWSTLTTAEIINFLTGDLCLSKARTSDLFWRAIWPRLVARGWHSEEPRHNDYKEVFLVPGIMKFSESKLVKGNQYFDSISDVLNKVSSDPGLIELDTEHGKGYGCKKSKHINETKLEDSFSLELQRQHNLKSRIPVHARDNMKLTAAGTRLGSREPYKGQDSATLVMERGSSKNVCTWYDHLPTQVRAKVDASGLSTLVFVLKNRERNKVLLHALSKLWLKGTQSFNFADIELTMTPADFSAITGLPVGGERIPIDKRIHLREDRMKELLGSAHLPIFKDRMKIGLHALYNHFSTYSCHTPAQQDIVARAFLLHLLGSTIFSDRTDYIYCLPALEDLSQVYRYDWGGAALIHVYRLMDCVSQGKTGMSGLWHAWEVWAYEYLHTQIQGKQAVENTIFPRVLKYHNILEVDEDHDLSWFQSHFDRVWWRNVNQNPWGDGPHPQYFLDSIPISGRSKSFDGPFSSVFYSGERFLHQIYKLAQPHHAAQIPIFPSWSIFHNNEHFQIPREEDADGYPLPDWITHIPVSDANQLIQQNSGLKKMLAKLLTHRSDKYKKCKKDKIAAELRIEELKKGKQKDATELNYLRTRVKELEDRARTRIAPPPMGCSGLTTKVPVVSESSSQNALPNANYIFACKRKRPLRFDLQIKRHKP